MSETTNNAPQNDGGSYYPGQPLTPELLTAAFAAKVDGMGGQMYGGTIGSSTITGGKVQGTDLSGGMVNGKDLQSILETAPTPSPLLADLSEISVTSGPSTQYAGDIQQATVVSTFPPAGVTIPMRLTMQRLLSETVSVITSCYNTVASFVGTPGETDTSNDQVYRIGGVVGPEAQLVGGFNTGTETGVQPNGNGTGVVAPVASIMQLLFGTDANSAGYADGNIKGSSRQGILPFLVIGGEAPSSSKAKGVKGAVIVPTPSDAAPSYAYICLSTAETDGGGNWVRFALTSSF